jgi:hypothetical protein
MASFPATGTPLLDSFDGPDGPLPAGGGNWIGPDPTVFSIGDGGRLVDTVSGMPLFWHTPFAGAQEAYATFAAYENQVYDMELLFNAHATGSAIPADAKCEALSVSFSRANGNGINVGYCHNENAVGIDAHVGGSDALQPGDELGARVYANGCVIVYKNRAVYWYSDARGFPYLGMGGYIGVYSDYGVFGPASPSEWDGFGGGTLP